MNCPVCGDQNYFEIFTRRSCVNSACLNFDPTAKINGRTIKTSKLKITIEKLQKAFKFSGEDPHYKITFPGKGKFNIWIDDGSLVVNALELRRHDDYDSILEFKSLPNGLLIYNYITDCVLRERHFDNYVFVWCNTKITWEQLLLIYEFLATAWEVCPITKGLIP